MQENIFIKLLIHCLNVLLHMFIAVLGWGRGLFLANTKLIELVRISLFLQKMFIIQFKTHGSLL